MEDKTITVFDKENERAVHIDMEKRMVIGICKAKDIKKSKKLINNEGEWFDIYIRDIVDIDGE